MSAPNVPGAVPPPPDWQTPPPPPVPPSNDDIPTAPFQAVPAPPPPATGHGPVPPPPPEPAVAPVQVPPAAPVRRVSATQRVTHPQGAPSGYAAAAPQPAPPSPRRSIAPGPVAAQDQGDWFGAAAQQQAAQSYPPAGYPPATQARSAYAPAPAAPGGAAGGYGGAPAGPAAEEPSRRRLTPGWIAFIALDVVLLVAVVVVAWNVMTGPPPADEAGRGTDRAATLEAEPGGGQDATTEPTEDTAAPAVLAQFRSPSRNIVCTITEADVSCSIADLNQQPAPVDGCEGTVGYRVTIDGATGEVALPCVPASEQPQTAAESLESLEYGQSRTQGQFTCTSEQSGMSCKDDESGKGFTLARAGIGTF